MDSMDEDQPPPSSPSNKIAMTSPGLPLQNFCPDNWTWNKRDKSHEVRLHGTNFKTAHFHPNWSNGTAGVRGTRVLNRGRFYWEINVTQRIFGTSMMFGIGTKKARLHADAFVNMLGADEHGWGLSHKGLLWHNGAWRQFAKPFRENEATTVGLLFDGLKGTLSYFKDGVGLGVAFTDLHLVQEDLYPIVCSTAAKTEMALGLTRREFCNLQDRCRSTILSVLSQAADPPEEAVRRLHLPNPIRLFLLEAVEESRGCEEPPRNARQGGQGAVCTRAGSCGPQRLNDVQNYLVV